MSWPQLAAEPMRWFSILVVLQMDWHLSRSGRQNIWKAEHLTKHDDSLVLRRNSSCWISLLEICSHFFVSHFIPHLGWECISYSCFTTVFWKAHNLSNLRDLCLERNFASGYIIFRSLQEMIFNQICGSNWHKVSSVSLMQVACVLLRYDLFYCWTVAL